MCASLDCTLVLLLFSVPKGPLSCPVLQTYVYKNDLALAPNKGWLFRKRFEAFFSHFFGQNQPAGMRTGDHKEFLATSPPLN